jgi:hypothetical protein
MRSAMNHAYVDLSTSESNAGMRSRGAVLPIMLGPCFVGVRFLDLVTLLRCCR